jgi:hypothetical protein
MHGYYNGINVLQYSPLFAKPRNGELPPVEFEANELKYTTSYYLADGIYPKWATFLKAVHDPHGKKEVQLHNGQVTARKDVERAFGILRTQFAIVRGLTRLWYQENLWHIMMACAIMHSMIIENEQGKYKVYTIYHFMDQ